MQLESNQLNQEWPSLPMLVFFQILILKVIFNFCLLLCPGLHMIDDSVGCDGEIILKSSPFLEFSTEELQE